MILPRSRRFWSLAATAWTILICVLCWTPRQHLPSDENTPRYILLPFIHVDKVVHTVLFLGFAVLWRASGRGERLVLALGIALTFATEFGQVTPWVGRDATISDMLADAAGVLLGLIVMRVVGRSRRLRVADEATAQAELA